MNKENEFDTYTKTYSPEVTFKEVLQDEDYERIMVRAFINFNEEIYETLFGYCQYKDGELISLDGDDYYLDESICKAQFFIYRENPAIKKLVVWKNLDTY